MNNLSPSQNPPLTAAGLASVNAATSPITTEARPAAVSGGFWDGLRLFTSARSR